MTLSPWPRFGSLLLLGVFLGTVGNASAQNKAPSSPRGAEGSGRESLETAAEHFRQGVRAFKEGDFELALVEFRRAQQIAPDFRVQYNLAQTLLELRRYGEAYSSFSAYLDEGGDRVPPPRRAAVADDLRNLEGRVAHIRLTVDGTGASVLVDDNPSGSTPLEKPLVVSAGRRKIVVTKEGYLPFQRTVELAGRDRIELEVHLEVPGREPPPSIPEGAKEETPRSLGARKTPMPVPAHEGTSPWSRPYVATGLVASGVLTLGACITGALALSAHGDYAEAERAFPGDGAALDSARRRTRLFSLTTDVVGGLAIVTLAGTAYLAFRPASPTATPSSKASRGGWPTVGVGLGTAFVQGVF